MGLTLRMMRIMRLFQPYPRFKFRISDGVLNPLKIVSDRDGKTRIERIMPSQEWSKRVEEP